MVWRQGLGRGAALGVSRGRPGGGRQRTAAERPWGIPATAGERVPAARVLSAVGRHVLPAGAVHLLVAPEHFQEWWGYGCFFLVLATFQTLYSLGLAAPAGLLPRREAYLLVGITANLLVLGLYVVSRTRGIPLFGPPPVSWSP